MFIGEYSYTIDDKSRLAIPNKFRSDLAKGAVITRSPDKCLFIYTKAEGRKLAEKVANLPFSQSGTRAFARLMLAGATEATLDKQGRIILPEYLKKFAGLKKQVIIAGLYNRLEIWDESTWAKYKQSTERNSEEIAERMGELGV